MRKVNTDNLYYGEALIDRLVWIDVTTKGMNEFGEKIDCITQYKHKAILQVTNWRFICTVLDESVDSHKVYWDFSWNEVSTIDSVGDQLVLTLKDESTISIEQHDADIASIRLWAISEAIKTEEIMRSQNKGQESKSSLIDIDCKSIVSDAGDWSRILSSYGISCKDGDKPKRISWNHNLTIDVVERAFNRRNIQRSSKNDKFNDNSISTNKKKDISDRLNSSSSRNHNKVPSNSTTSEVIINRKRNPAQQKILNEINSLIGLDEVKERAIDIVNLVEINEERRKQGLGTPVMSLHMVFTGNPGTGKTTIARLFGNIFKSLGILSSGHFVEVDRSGLVGGYLGQTAIKTTEVLEKALGGILFIDEAYSLAPGLEGDQFGQEAIDTILPFMDNHRNDLVVIAAGYTEEMKNFIRSNPGLESRFNTFINFRDYSAEELKKIFLSMVNSDKYIVHSICDADLDAIFSNLVKRSKKGFGNGREVRNIYEKTLLNQNRRLVSIGDLDRNKLSEILPCDLPPSTNFRRNDDENNESISGNTTQRLESLIGIPHVKKEIKKIVDMAVVTKRRIEAGLPAISPPSLHMVFTGNPGTGKTTVARCLAKELYELGVLARNHLVEVSRSNLVAGYLGQTAIKTTNVLDNALGGVLFIDEAYTLNQEHSGGVDTFGLEAIDTILKYMEDNKDSIMIIAAGYEREMKRFLESNPGLSSRFNRYIHFEDYTDDDLVEVFRSMVYLNKLEIHDSAHPAIKNILSKVREYEGDKFSNARAARNLFEKTVENQASRIAAMVNPSLEDMQLLTLEDISFR